LPPVHAGSIFLTRISEDIRRLFLYSLGFFLENIAFLNKFPTYLAEI
jgi:hypothetical protein